MAFLMILLGSALVLGPWFIYDLPSVARLALVGFGVLNLLGGAGIGLLSFYRKTSADQAYVRTGWGGAQVVLDGGTILVPWAHRILEVNLKTMKLGVNPKGSNALITRDNLRADVLAQFYIRVQADREHILNAARSLGEYSVNAETVEALVSEKLVSALRAIASQMDLFEIHTKRDEFADRVKEHVRSDLEANGLLLESVTISELDQTDPSALSDNNVFDAQGKRKITEITAMALVERNRLERDAELARKERDVVTRQQILELERRQAESESRQATEVAIVRASRDRESKEAEIGQQQAIESAKIIQNRVLQEAEIARILAVEKAKVDQNRAVQLAELGREQALQTAQVERAKQVELAERAKQIAVAEQEADRARAEQAALQAQAGREAAQQEVLKVQQLGEAQRDADRRLIAARMEIERDRAAQQTAAEVAAFTQVKEAEAEQEATLKRASARREMALADADSRKLSAEADLAVQRIPVEVERERVQVRQAEVAVERQQLENRQQFAEAGIALEIEKLRISASRDVQMEFARAMGQILGQGRMTVFGTPETANQLLNNLTKGLGFRSLVDGVLGGNSDTSPVDATLTQAGDLVRAAMKRIQSEYLEPKDSSEKPPSSLLKHESSEDSRD